MLRHARLRVGLGAAVLDAAPGTGHGTVWRHVLAELSQMRGVKLVSQGRADVWLSSGHAEAPEGRPLVVQIHEIGWIDPFLRSFLDPEFAELMETTTAATLAVASHAITPSRSARDQVLEAVGWSADRVHAIHHGVDHEVFRPGIGGGQQRIGAPYVVFVAVLHPRKNFAAVREAVAGLARGGLPHVLALLGTPAADRRHPSELELQGAGELDALPGRVVRLGGLSEGEVAALIAGADVLCLPSFFEGFGLPVLEAMACGTPVVVSDRGALPEVVGDAGLVVAPEPGPVEQALREVLTDSALAQRLARVGVQRAAGFTWAATARGWLAVLRAAAEAREPPPG